MTAVALGLNILPKLVFKVVKNRKRSGYVYRHNGHINCPKSVFLQTKATHFETMVTTLNESTAIKQRYEFIFRCVSRVCFIAEIKE